MAKVFGTHGERILQLPRDDQASLALLEGGWLGFGASRSNPIAQIPDEQFRLFNLCVDGGSHFFQDPHDTVPSLEGTAEKPDVRARIEMLAFNPGKIATDDTRATLRLDVGQDSLSTSKLQPLFWSIAAGLDLSEAIKGGDPGTPTRYRDDFTANFGERPIEVPGGLAELRFEVVTHPEKPWWREIFSFLTSDTAKTLISAFGFPGIATEAIKIIDQAFDLLGDDHRVLFRSSKMQFALSKFARDEYTLGTPGVSIGALNRGFALLAPQRFYEDIIRERPQFIATYGRLIPGAWKLEEYLAGKLENIFDAMPYAVLRIRSESYSAKGTL